MDTCAEEDEDEARRAAEKEADAAFEAKLREEEEADIEQAADEAEDEDMDDEQRAKAEAKRAQRAAARAEKRAVYKEKKRAQKDKVRPISLSLCLHLCTTPHPLSLLSPAQGGKETPRCWPVPSLRAPAEAPAQEACPVVTHAALSAAQPGPCSHQPHLLGRVSEDGGGGGAGDHQGAHRGHGGGCQVQCCLCGTRRFPPPLSLPPSSTPFITHVMSCALPTGV